MSRDEIAREAFKLFQARHGIPGDPVADWFEAERIVKARTAVTAQREAEASATRGGGSNNRRSRASSRSGSKGARRRR